MWPVVRPWSWVEAQKSFSLAGTSDMSPGRRRMSDEAVEHIRLSCVQNQQQVNL